MFSDGAVAAIAGAIVGIAGTGLVAFGLQHARFRREDLEGIRARLGIARALDSELRGSRLQLASGLTAGKLPAGTQFTVATWQTHGPTLVAALREDALGALVDVFGRLSVLNHLMASRVLETHGMDLSHDSEASLGPKVAELQAKIDVALETLSGIESQYIAMEQDLTRPWHRRLPWSA